MSVTEMELIGKFPMSPYSLGETLEFPQGISTELCPGKI